MLVLVQIKDFFSTKIKVKLSVFDSFTY